MGERCHTQMPSWSPASSKGSDMRIQRPSEGELRERLARLLSELGMTRDELAERAGEGLLSADQYWALEEIRSVEFLLGEHDEPPAAAAG